MREEKKLIKNKKVRIAVSISVYAICLVLAVAGIYTLGSVGFQVGNAIFNEQSIDPVRMGMDVVVVVDEGKNSDSDIAHILYANGLVENEWICKVQIMLSEYKGQFNAGVYTLSTEMKPTQMFEKLAQTKEE